MESGVTKQEFVEFKEEMKRSFATAFEMLHFVMERMVTKDELEEFKKETRREFQDVRTEMRAGFREVRTRLDKLEDRVLA